MEPTGKNSTQTMSSLIKSYKAENTCVKVAIRKWMDRCVMIGSIVKEHMI